MIYGFCLFVYDYYLAILKLICIEEWLDKNISEAALIAIPALIATLFVAIAAFLMERQDSYSFDKKVILDKIILAKWSILLLILESIVLLCGVSTLSVMFGVILLLEFIFVLSRVYKWTIFAEELKHKTIYKQEMRLQFIRSIKKETEKVDIWTIILSDEKLPEKNQHGLVVELIATVKSVQDSEDRCSKTTLLNLINHNLSKIDFADIQSYKDLVEYSIEYFSEKSSTRETNNQAASNKNRKKYPPYAQRALATNLLKTALDHDNSDLYKYIYFTVIREYTAKDGIDELGFIREFLPLYINTVKENEKYDAGKLWEVLQDWIVTEELLRGEESRGKAMSLLKVYIDLIFPMVRLGKKPSDHEARVIDDITKCLLPEINTSFWFDIITFYNVAAFGLNKGEDIIHGLIRSYVTRAGRTFGFDDRVNIENWVDDEQERLASYVAKRKEHDEETIYILRVMFKQLCNNNETQKVLAQIKEIEAEKLFHPDSSESQELELLKTRFENIQTYHSTS